MQTADQTPASSSAAAGHTHTLPLSVPLSLLCCLQSVNSEGQPDSWTPPSFRAFLLFTGAAMSFTAFPVLASLLSSSGLLAAPIGLQV